MSENLISLHNKVQSNDDAVKYLQDNSILKTEIKCEVCDKKLIKTVKNQMDNCVYFRCRPCGFQESIRKDTFLFGKVGHALYTSLYTIHYAPYQIHYILYNIHFTLYTLHYHTKHYTIYVIQYTLYTINYTIYTIHYTLYTIHYTLYTIQVIV